MKILFLAGSGAEAERVRRKWPDVVVAPMLAIPAIKADVVVVEPLPLHNSRALREEHAQIVKYAAQRYLEPTPVIIGTLA